MHIARIQVEEGFLDGLDLRLTPGLVTLIGARGTGKTSVIELIRFCLDINGYTAESTKRSRDHALSVLGSGQITVTIADGAREVIVSRTAAEEHPRGSPHILPPIVFSQTEIENVGMQPGGRLRLLDGFIEGRVDLDRDEAAAAAEVRSLTLEAKTLRQEIDELRQRQNELPELNTHLAALAPQESALAAISAEANGKSVQLAEITAQSTKMAVAGSALERFSTVLQMTLQNADNAVRTASHLDAWPQEIIDLAVEARAQLTTATQQIISAAETLRTALVSTATLSASMQAERLELEERARAVRREIEELQVGAGATMRRGQLLRERKAQLEALGATLAARSNRLMELTQRRNGALDLLDDIRAARHESRGDHVQSLNRALGPRIRLQLARSGQFERFSAVLSEGLRGSGLRYGDLSEALAQSISPRELLEAIENNDIDLISDVAGISGDRALKVLGSLKETDLGMLATVLIEDDVRFELLDGSDYKDISELSTGQRCTVVLPIVLQHRGRLLIVDQPEDHIDNAFIADTLIRSILNRDSSGQILFTTHNANIPVLGEADQVVEMDSDGRRGFARFSAPLDSDEAVKAITTVMEGGSAAFNTRAQFYAQHHAR